MWTEVLDRYADQGWSDSTKLMLLLDFLDANEHTVATPEMFADFIEPERE